MLKILTENLSTEQFGYYSLWLSILLFVRQVIYDPISIVAAKQIGNRKIEKSQTILIYQAIRIFSRNIFFFFLPIIIIIILIINNGKNEINFVFFLILGFFYIISNGPQGIYINLLNAEGLRKLSSIFISLDGLIKLILTTALIVIFTSKLESAVTGVAFSSLLLFATIRWIAFPNNSDQLSQQHNRNYTLKNLLLSCFPFVIPVTIMAARSAGDKWFMASFLGVEELAAYSVLLQLGFLPMNLAVGVFQTYFTPVIYGLSTSNHPENRSALLRLIDRTIIKISAFSAIITILSCYLSDYFVSIAVGEAYLDYSYLLPTFVAAGAIFGLSNLCNVAAIGLFSTKQTGLLMGLSVTLAIVVTALFINYYEFIGGVIAIFTTSCFSLFIYRYALHFWRPPQR